MFKMIEYIEIGQFKIPKFTIRTLCYVQIDRKFVNVSLKKKQEV